MIQNKLFFGFSVLSGLEYSQYFVNKEWIVNFLSFAEREIYLTRELPEILQ